MPKKAKYPMPTKRYVNGAWVILWRFSPLPGEYRQYTVSTSLTREKEDDIEADIVLRDFAKALAKDPPEFPLKYAATPGVRRYLSDRRMQPAGKWIADYEPILRQEVSEMWANPSLAILKKLNLFTDQKIEWTTPDQARTFLAKLTEDEKTVAWRNRALSMCNRFFKWAVDTKRTHENPFFGIKTLTEPRSGEIVYCTREERDRIIAMAKATKWPDWLAVPIAFFTGMRKEEIARMRWADIHFFEGRIAVPVTKTKESRLLPLSSQLRELLEEVPEGKRQGYVVDIPKGVERIFRMENLHRKIRKMNAGVGRWKKDADKNKSDAERGREPIPEARIGWNAWRHTFGSLLAQSGVGLDKISSWMGNTPEVCRRHYAQFVPRDRHDDDIDKL